MRRTRVTIEEIISTAVAYLKTLPDGTEISASEALKATCRFDYDPNGEFLVGNTPADFEEMLYSTVISVKQRVRPG